MNTLVFSSFRYRFMIVWNDLVIKFLHQLETNGVLNRKQPHRLPGFLSIVVQTNKEITTSDSFAHSRSTS